MKSIEEIVHILIIALSPVFIVVSHLLEISEKIIEFLIVPIVVLVNILLVLRFSRNKENENINFVSNFIHDRFHPTDEGAVIPLDYEIFVIEDEAHSNEFREKTQKHLKWANDKLTFKSFDWAEYQDPAKQPEALKEIIKKKKAVIVVRTKELEEKEWVYQIVEDWAHDNPDAPCLYVNNLDEGDQISKVPKYICIMPLDERTTPWMLLKRSVDRSLAWRSQASFNRFVAKSFAILFSLSLTVGLFLWFSEANKVVRKESEKVTAITQKDDEKNKAISLNKKETESARKGMHAAFKTKEHFATMARMHGLELNVSYFMRYEERPCVFVTTESIPVKNCFDKEEDSVINYVFNNIGSAAQWNKSNFQKSEDGDWGKCNVFDKNGSEKDKKDHDCKMQGRNEEIESIVCVSYESSNLNRNNTVGICLFSVKGMVEFDKIDRGFLKTEAMNFYTDFLNETLSTLENRMR